MSTTTAPATVTSLELELTRRCPLQCTHCYSDSGPIASHGTMTTPAWEKVITDAAAHGVATVQFIGGEPTSHPDFAHLLRHAIAAGLRVEVYTNLYRVKDAWWELFTHPAVSLATSYYSDIPAGHDIVTGRHGSHARTRANIAEAVRRQIRIRVGIIDVLDGQRTAQAKADLRGLGVTAIGTDRMRGIGRAALTTPDVGELCGHCGHGSAAISTDGDVWPCVMSRWMPCAGNVRREPLGDILIGERMRDLVAAISAARKEHDPCAPDKTGCKPKEDGGDCQPAERDGCRPDIR